MAHKAPGKSYRKGITLQELFRLFPDDKMAEAWLEEQLWEGTPFCPACASENVKGNQKHKSMPWRCCTCQKRFSLKTGTAMEGSNLGYQTWVVAIFLLTTSLKGVSSMKLHRDLGITQKSAWHLAHRIRKALKEDEFRFIGPVEVDETYMGGLEKNRHADQKKGMGRGPVGKVPVVGIRDRDSNQIDAFPVVSTGKVEMARCIAERTDIEAAIYTDDHRSYEGLPNHESVKHSVKEFVRDQVHTNGIESFWAMLKRGYHGTYHKMSTKHLDRYVSEFAGRHNDRNRDTLEQMSAIVNRMVGRRLKYKDLTWKAC